MKKQALTLGTAALLSTGITASVNADTQHTVQKGDTLSELALNYNTTVDALKSLNNLSSELILVDQKLVVDKEDSEAVKYHDIQKGDTLFLIGKQYGKTVQQLKALNDLESDLIIAGEKLIVDKKESANSVVQKPVQQKVHQPAAPQVAKPAAQKEIKAEKVEEKQEIKQQAQNNAQAAEKAEQQKQQAERVAAQKAAEQKAAEQKAAEQKAAEQKATAERQAQAEARQAQQEKIAAQKAAEQKAAEKRAQAQKAQQQRAKAQQVSNGRTIRVSATHYTAGCAGCSGITATGIDVRNSIYAGGKRVIAVDPRVIPLGSTVQVTTPYGSFTAIAGDTGGAIKGNIIDILVGSKGEAYSKGRTSATVTILN
ncbi:3D domain-containing protein [Abyssicoccus albus]|uniref:3D (Asp-Asp-Asp) domain-containing protein n=1 Tax=Abyssicoccus albus TaxID=1817405 RepID=A0A3N5BFD2_9BACL|nr:3D domain-containing protein [Abyssicoccus albus]RPF56426.1 3D (Asp-Asp-Asp) domain-containing protein [Abyssicoccus albus]